MMKNGLPELANLSEDELMALPPQELIERVDRGSLEQARDALKTLVKQKRCDIAFLIGLGFRYYKASHNQKAVCCYEQVAELGSDIAMCSLGLIYQKGEVGVPKDLIKAAEYFIASAKKNTGYADGSMNARTQLCAFSRIFSESVENLFHVYQKVYDFDRLRAEDILKIRVDNKDVKFCLLFVSELLQIYRDGCDDEKKKSSIVEQLVEILCEEEKIDNKYVSRAISIIRVQYNTTSTLLFTLMKALVLDPYFIEGMNGLFRFQDLTIPMESCLEKMKTFFENDIERDNSADFKENCDSMLIIISMHRLFNYFKKECSLTTLTEEAFHNFFKFINKISPKNKAESPHNYGQIIGTYSEISRRIASLPEGECGKLLGQYGVFLRGLLNSFSGSEEREKKSNVTQTVLANILLLICDPETPQDALIEKLKTMSSGEQCLWKKIIYPLATLFPVFKEVTDVFDEGAIETSFLRK